MAPGMTEAAPVVEELTTTRTQAISSEEAVGIRRCELSLRPSADANMALNARPAPCGEDLVCCGSVRRRLLSTGPRSLLAFRLLRLNQIGLRVRRRRRAKTPLDPSACRDSPATKKTMQAKTKSDSDKVSYPPVRDTSET